MALAILVVDHPPDSAESLAQLLTLYGYEARFATTGAEALAVWREFPADVVITEIRLPDEDGYAVAMKLCAESNRRPLLVVLTVYNHLEKRSHAEGIDHHFLKPVDPCVLADALRAHAVKIAKT